MWKCKCCVLFICWTLVGFCGWGKNSTTWIALLPVTTTLGASFYLNILLSSASQRCPASHTQVLFNLLRSVSNTGSHSKCAERKKTRFSCTAVTLVICWRFWSYWNGFAVHSPNQCDRVNVWSFRFFIPLSYLIWICKLGTVYTCTRSNYTLSAREQQVCLSAYIMLPEGVWGQADLGGIFLFEVVTIVMSCVAMDHMQKNLSK